MKNTNLALRKHFDHKFDSRIPIDHPDKKVKGISYKSKFRSTNNSVEGAARIIHRYNSKIY